MQSSTVWNTGRGVYGRTCGKLGWASPQDVAALPDLGAKATMAVASTRQHASWQGLADRPRTCPRSMPPTASVHADLCATSGAPPQVVYCVTFRPVAQLTDNKFGSNATSSQVWPCPTVTSCANSILCIKSDRGCALSAFWFYGDNAHLFSPGCTWCTAPYWNPCSSVTAEVLLASSWHASRPALPQASI